MKQLGRIFSRVFGTPEPPRTQEEASRARIYREWDRQRARAMSPSERDEIDAIFSRAL